MDELTDRQSEILKLIRELTEVSGFPPTRAEIAERMGFRSVNAAEQHLRALEKKGAIEISAGSSRGIKVRDARPAGRSGRLLELPVIGRVAAGSPMLAEEHVTEPGDHDLAAARLARPVHREQVAFQDARIAHRQAAHAQQVVGARREQIRIDLIAALQMLLGEDRAARGHASDDRQLE